MEGIDIPLVRRIASIDKLVGQGVSRADLGPAAFASVVERVLVHFLGGGVMNDVDRLDSLIVSLNPGVDPEGLDANDVLLIVGHGAGNVHHVNDDRDALRLTDFFPAAILFVLANRNNQRSARIVRIGGDLTLESTFESALEMAERFRTGLANAGIAVA